jgi:SfnB family sulfur acquisition oxidoreductase
MDNVYLGQVRSSLTGLELVQAANAVAATLAAGAAGRDATRTLPYDEMRALQQTGLLAARIERQFGGPDVSFVELSDIMLHLAAGDPNVAQSVQPHFFFVEQLRLDGTPAQRAKFASAILQGALVANAFAERGTKFVGEIRTTLLRDGDLFRLKGTKFFSTGSLFADYLYAPAMMEDGTQAVAVFPRDRQGVSVIDDWDGMGQRTTASGTTLLDNVLINHEEIIPLLRVKERRTYLGAAAQILHAAIDVGIAKAAFGDAVQYVPNARPVSESGVQKASEDPYLVHAIGEMAVILHGAEMMLRRAGDFLDRAATAQLSDTQEGSALDRMLAQASIAVAEAKACANGAALQICEMMYQVGGASMTLRAYNYDRHWRNARTHTTHDPVAYKFKAIGDFFLNGRYPNISTKI